MLLAFTPAVIVEGLSLLLLPMSGAMLIRWGPGSARPILQNRPLHESEILAVAMATMAFAAGWQSLWRLAYRWLGRPIGMEVSPWVGFPLYVFLISMLLALLATRRRTDPPMKTLIWITAALTAVVLALWYFTRNWLGNL